MERDARDLKCLEDLCLADPRRDKARIEQTGGGLLQDSYRWVLDLPVFEQWRQDQGSRLLWIHGGPGSGKTILLCGIVDELEKSTASPPLSFFFCQASDARASDATTVLRGLIYLLVSQQPVLISHVQKKYEKVGQSIFEDAYSWTTLSGIFINILQDSAMQGAYIIVDALDECVTNMPQLLNLIVDKSTVAPNVKWLVSSRKWRRIEDHLGTASLAVELGREASAEPVAIAVRAYTSHRIQELSERKGYDENTMNAVRDHISSNDKATFLWVSLVCRDLESAPRPDALSKLTAHAHQLDGLYGRLLRQILESSQADFCRQVLAATAIARRPLTTEELASLVALPEEIFDNTESLAEVITLCGSFLSLHDGTVYFVHLSARDYLLGEAYFKVFPAGMEYASHRVFSRSLDILSATLGRDIYGLGVAEISIDQVRVPNPDPLAPARYSCVYWVDHLCDSLRHEDVEDCTALRDDGPVCIFIKAKFIYWLEALSLLRRIHVGVVAMWRLGEVARRAGRQPLTDLIRDACQFMSSHLWIVETNPLQMYRLALAFGAAHSLAGGLFPAEESDWVTVKPLIQNRNVQTLRVRGDNDELSLWTTFSSDGRRLASMSGRPENTTIRIRNDMFWQPESTTIRIWDVMSGKCIQTLDSVVSVAFSSDKKHMATTVSEEAISIWDLESAQCKKILRNHDDWARSVTFSTGGEKACLALTNNTFEIWNVTSGELERTIQGDGHRIQSFAMSPEGSCWVTASGKMVKIWSVGSGSCRGVLEGHSDQVQSVSFSSDADHVASASNDKTIKIWNAWSCRHERTLKGHNDAVVSAVFSADGTYLASASYDKTVRIWDTTLGTCIKTLEGHNDSVTSVVFSASDKYLTSASCDKAVRVWDFTTGKCMQTLEGHSGPVRSVAFSPSENQLASASDDKTVRVWDLSNGNCVTLEGHADSVVSVAFSPGNTQLASVSTDKTMRIWTAKSGECRQTIKRYNNDMSLALSSDGSRLASANGKVVQIWDTNSGECIQTLEGRNDSMALIAFSPDGEELASTSDDKVVQIWNATSGKCTQTLHVGRHPLISAVFSPDGKHLASTSRNGMVRIWQAASGSFTKRFKTDLPVIFSPDGGYIVSVSADNKILIRDTSSFNTLQILEGHAGSVASVAFSPDGKHLASGSEDKTTRIWDTVSGKCTQVLESYGSIVTSVTFSPDGTHLASASTEGKVKIWETASAKYIPVLDSSVGLVVSVSLSPDGKWFASASADNSIRIRHTTSGKFTQILAGHGDWIRSLVFSPDSKYLASASDDRTIRVWDITSGECIGKLEGHSDWVRSIVYSANGEHLASASDDKTVIIWDITSGSCTRRLEGHNDAVVSVAFSPDGKYLVSASEDKKIRIWDAKSGDAVTLLEVRGGSVQSVVFSPDGRRLASVLRNDTVGIWDVATSGSTTTFCGPRMVQSINGRFRQEHFTCKLCSNLARHLDILHVRHSGFWLSKQWHVDSKSLPGCLEHAPLFRAFGLLTDKEAFFLDMKGFSDRESQTTVKVSNIEGARSGTKQWTLAVARRNDVPQHNGIGCVLDPDWADVAKIKLWKDLCLSLHGNKCNDHLGIKSKASPAWLIDVEERRLVRGGERDGGRYVALSYVWGSSSRGNVQIEDINALQESDALTRPEIIAKFALAPIVGHSMHVTSRLGERYLWIDALCIVRGDPSMEAQIKLMGAIYANAILTIVAACGTADLGLPGIRGISRPREQRSRLEIPFRDETILARPMEGVAVEYHTRGWTFQEYQLSSRRLVFQDGLLHWYCTSGVCAEDDFAVQPFKGNSQDKKVQIDKIRGGVPVLGELNRALNLFNTRNLTFDEDAYPSISGFLNLLDPPFTGGFLFGLPERLFDGALGWFSAGDCFRRIASSRPAEKRLPNSDLPSWSWVGWRGRIHIPKRPLDESDENSDETIPITEWYTASTSDGADRRRITSTWYEDRAAFRKNSSQLPEGWSRHRPPKPTFSSGRPRTPNEVFWHSSIPWDFHYPFTILDRAEDVDTKPRATEQTPFLFCETTTAILWGKTHSELQVSEYRRHHDDSLLQISLYDAAEKAVGFLTVQNEQQYGPFLDKSGERKLGVPVDLVAISLCSRGWYSWSYKVLWIKWENGVAYRLGAGEVSQDEWKKLDPKPVSLILG